MVEDIEKIQKELDHYKKLFGIGDIATRAYISFVNVLEMQVEVLNDFKIKEKIGNVTKDDPMYDRCIKIYEGMADNISKLKRLELELGITYDDKQGLPKIKASNPQNIGK